MKKHSWKGHEFSSVSRNFTFASSELLINDKHIFQRVDNLREARPDVAKKIEKFNVKYDALPQIGKDFIREVMTLLCVVKYVVSNLFSTAHSSTPTTPSLAIDTWLFCSAGRTYGVFHRFRDPNSRIKYWKIMLNQGFQKRGPGMPDKMIFGSIPFWLMNLTFSFLLFSVYQNFHSSP